MTKNDLFEAVNKVAETALELKAAKDELSVARSKETNALNAMNEARKVYNRLMGEFLKENDPEYRQEAARATSRSHSYDHV